MLVVCVAEPAIYGGEDGLVGPVCGVLRSLVDLVVAFQCHAGHCGIDADGAGPQIEQLLAWRLVERGLEVGCLQCAVAQLVEPVLDLFAR